MFWLVSDRTRSSAALRVLPALALLLLGLALGGVSAAPVLAQGLTLRVRVLEGQARPGGQVQILVIPTRQLKAVRGIVRGVAGRDLPITFQIGMNSAGGRVELPAETRPGSYTVEVEAEDATGAKAQGRDVFTVRPSPIPRNEGKPAPPPAPPTQDNQPPVLSVSVEPTSVGNGEAVRVEISVVANEPLRELPTGRITGLIRALEFVRVGGTNRNFRTRVELPAGTRPDTYPIEVSGVDESRNAGIGRAALRVTAAPVPVRDTQPPVLTLALRPETVSPGEAVVVTVEANEPLRELPTGRITGLNRTLEFVRIGGTNRTFRTRVELPAGTRPDTYPIEVSGVDESRNAGIGRAALRVTAAPVPVRDTQPPVLTLALRPETVSPGEAVVVTVDANEPLADTPAVEFSGGPALPLRLQAGAGRRRFTGRIAVPEDARPARYTLTVSARDEAGNAGRTQAMLTVLALPEPQLRLTVRPETAQPGDEVQLALISDLPLRGAPVVSAGRLAAAIRLRGRSGFREREFEAAFVLPEDTRPGDYPLEVSARAVGGGSGRAAATLRVLPDSRRPELTVRVLPEALYPGSPLSLTVVASEALAGGVAVDGLPGGGLTLSPSPGSRRTFEGSATLSPSLRPGNYSLRFSGRDAAGNEGVRSVEIRVAALPTLRVTLSVDPVRTGPGRVDIQLRVNQPVRDGEAEVWLELPGSRRRVDLRAAAPRSGDPPGRLRYPLRVTRDDPSGRAVVRARVRRLNQVATDEAALEFKTQPPSLVGLRLEPNRPRAGDRVTLTALFSEPLRQAPALTLARGFSCERIIGRAVDARTYVYSFVFGQEGRYQFGFPGVADDFGNALEFAAGLLLVSEVEPPERPQPIGLRAECDPLPLGVSSIEVRLPVDRSRPEVRAVLPDGSSRSLRPLKGREPGLYRVEYEVGEEETGTLRLEATADGCEPGRLSVRVDGAAPRFRVTARDEPLRGPTELKIVVSEPLAGGQGPQVRYRQADGSDRTAVVRSVPGEPNTFLARIEPAENQGDLILRVRGSDRAGNTGSREFVVPVRDSRPAPPAPRGPRWSLRVPGGALVPGRSTVIELLTDRPPDGLPVGELPGVDGPVRFEKVDEFLYRARIALPAELAGKPVSLRVKDGARDETFSLEAAPAGADGHVAAADRWAILVALRRYSTLPPVDRAYRDAARARALLLRQGYQDDRILVITDGRPDPGVAQELALADPRGDSRAGLSRALEAAVARARDGGARTLLCGFWGHPATLEGAPHLLAPDADPERLAEAAVPFSLLLDSAYGPAGGEPIPHLALLLDGMRDERGAPAFTPAPLPPRAGQTRVALYGTREGQTAFEGSTAPAGEERLEAGSLFFYALAASLEQEDPYTWDALTEGIAAALRDRLRRWAERDVQFRGRTQEPAYFASPEDARWTLRRFFPGLRAGTINPAPGNAEPQPAAPAPATNQDPPAVPAAKPAPTAVGNTSPGAKAPTPAGTPETAPAAPAASASTAPRAPAAGKPPTTRKPTRRLQKQSGKPPTTRKRTGQLQKR